MNKLIAIDADALDDMKRDIAELKRQICRVKPLPEFMSIRDYADLIGISRRTVTRRINAGTLETANIGGERMVRVVIDQPAALP